MVTKEDLCLNSPNVIANVVTGTWNPSLLPLVLLVNAGGFVPSVVFVKRLTKND
tara:strand:- start:7151 stop:7312 length:162 start_codon:yes stop_codon:yes gene_type:complete